MLVKHSTDWKLMSPQLKSTHAHTHTHTHLNKQLEQNTYWQLQVADEVWYLIQTNACTHKTEMEHRLTATSSRQSLTSDPNPRTHNWNRTDWQPQVADKAWYLIQANTRTHTFTLLKQNTDWQPQVADEAWYLIQTHTHTHTHTTETEHRLTATSSRRSLISDSNPRTRNWNRTDWQPHIADKARYLIQTNARTHTHHWNRTQTDSYK